IGNTGNARTTPPHLHFGIYTSSGAVDPLPFIRPGKSTPSNITSDIKRIGDTVRALLNKEISINTPLLIEAATLNGYRVATPNNNKIFILQNQVATISQPLKTITLDQARQMYREPNTSAAIIAEYPPGKNLQVIG